MNLTSFYIAFHDPIWVILLTTVLFFPVRQMIWVLYVRKKQKTQNQKTRLTEDGVHPNEKAKKEYTGTSQ